MASAKLGDLAALAGDRPTARGHYDEARRLRVQLAERGGGDAKSDLAQVCVKLGDVSEPKAAVPLYQESLHLREEVVQEKPRDGAAARDVRVSHYKLADGYIKSGDPAARARAIVQATTMYDDPDVVAKVSRGLGEAMVGINVESLPVDHRLAQRGW